MKALRNCGNQRMMPSLLEEGVISSIFTSVRSKIGRVIMILLLTMIPYFPYQASLAQTSKQRTKHCWILLYSVMQEFSPAARSSDDNVFAELKEIAIVHTIV